MVVPPSNVTAICKNNTVYLYWDPSTTSGSTYTVSPSVGTQTSIPGNTLCTITGLTPNTWYTFGVKATSSGESSAIIYSNPVYTKYTGILYTKKDIQSPKDYLETKHQLIKYSKYNSNTSLSAFANPNKTLDRILTSSVGFWREYKAGLYKSRNSS